MWRILRSKHVTYATTVSVLALVVALGGTAWAAATLTSRNVANGSLTTKDVKNGTVESMQVAPATRTALAVPGDKGPDGPKGPTGVTGDVGPMGDKGTPAKNAFAWAYNIQSNLLPTRFSSNGPVAEDWYTNMGTGQWTNPDAGYSGGVLLELADGTNDGLLVLEARSDVYAMADLTVWHEDAAVHSRLECRMRITNIATNQQATLGQPVMVSSGQYRHVIPIGLVGGLRRDAGTYSVRVECRDLDLASTGYSKWYVAKGNLSVLSARDWR